VSIRFVSIRFVSIRSVSVRFVKLLIFYIMLKLVYVTIRPDIRLIRRYNYNTGNSCAFQKKLNLFQC
jgi:hypothetical protein